MDQTPLPALHADPTEMIRQEFARDPRPASHDSRRDHLADLEKLEKWRAGRPVSKLPIEQQVVISRNGKIVG